MQKTCIKCGHVSFNAAGQPTDACPSCGAIYAKARALAGSPATAAKPPRSQSASRRIFGVAVLVLLFSVAVSMFFAPGAPLVQAQMKSIHQQVAEDSMRQYNIARQHGGPMDVCVQAGMVAAAFLQAQQESQYASWKATESADCARAGLPK